jgi:hypothetical protein
MYERTTKGVPIGTDPLAVPNAEIIECLRELPRIQRTCAPPYELSQYQPGTHLLSRIANEPSGK